MVDNPKNKEIYDLVDELSEQMAEDLFKSILKKTERSKRKSKTYLQNEKKSEKDVVLISTDNKQENSQKMQKKSNDSINTNNSKHNSICNKKSLLQNNSAKIISHKNSITSPISVKSPLVREKLNISKNNILENDESIKNSTTQIIKFLPTTKNIKRYVDFDTCNSPRKIFKKHNKKDKEKKKTNKSKTSFKKYKEDSSNYNTPINILKNNLKKTLKMKLDLNDTSGDGFTTIDILKDYYSQSEESEKTKISINSKKNYYKLYSTSNYISQMKRNRTPEEYYNHQINILKRIKKSNKLKKFEQIQKDLKNCRKSPEIDKFSRLIVKKKGYIPIFKRENQIKIINKDEIKKELETNIDCSSIYSFSRNNSKDYIVNLKENINLFYTKQMNWKEKVEKKNEYFSQLQKEIHNKEINDILNYKIRINQKSDMIANKKILKYYYSENMDQNNISTKKNSFDRMYKYHQIYEDKKNQLTKKYFNQFFKPNIKYEYNPDKLFRKKSKQKEQENQNNINDNSEDFLSLKKSTNNISMICKIGKKHKETRNTITFEELINPSYNNKYIKQKNIISRNEKQNKNNYYFNSNSTRGSILRNKNYNFGSTNGEITTGTKIIHSSTGELLPDNLGEIQEMDSKSKEDENSILTVGFKKTLTDEIKRKNSSKNSNKITNKSTSKNPKNEEEKIEDKSDEIPVKKSSTKKNVKRFKSVCPSGTLKLNNQMIKRNTRYKNSPQKINDQTIKKINNKDLNENNLINLIDMKQSDTESIGDSLDLIKSQNFLIDISKSDFTEDNLNENKKGIKNNNTSFKESELENDSSRISNMDIPLQKKEYSWIQKLKNCENKEINKDKIVKRDNTNYFYNLYRLNLENNALNNIKVPFEIKDTKGTFYKYFKKK